MHVQYHSLPQSANVFNVLNPVFNLQYKFSTSLNTILSTWSTRSSHLLNDVKWAVEPTQTRAKHTPTIKWGLMWLNPQKKWWSLKCVVIVTVKLVKLVIERWTKRDDKKNDLVQNSGDARVCADVGVHAELDSKAHWSGRWKKLEESQESKGGFLWPTEGIYTAKNNKGIRATWTRPCLAECAETSIIIRISTIYWIY